MSIYRPTIPTQQSLRRQKTALTARLSQNMRLKVVSLVAAVALYVFVQNEHNPTLTREFSAEIQYQHVPPNAEVDSSQRRVTYYLSAPRALLDSIKDSDLRAVANFANRPLSVSKVQTLTQLTLQIPKLTPEQINQISIDPSGAAFRFRLIGFVKRDKSVSVPLKTPPSGSHYGKSLLQPAEVTLAGREDRVDMVDKVTLDYKTGDDGKIKGVFPVVLHDHDDAAIEGVTVTPPMVSVTVPLLPDALSKLVTVSADIKDSPAPPFNTYFCHVEPTQVKITGSGEAFNRTFTLQTDEISLRSETQSRDMSVNLVVPDGITVHDAQGNAIKKVNVHIVILHNTATPPVKTPKSVKPDTTPPLPPVDPNG